MLIVYHPTCTYHRIACMGAEMAPSLDWRWCLVSGTIFSEAHLGSRAASYTMCRCFPGPWCGSHPWFGYPFIFDVFCNMLQDNIHFKYIFHFARYIHAKSESIVLLRRPKMCRISGELLQTPRSSNKFLIELQTAFMFLWFSLRDVSQTCPAFEPILSTEAKVAAGTDIVKASLRAFVPQSMATIMLVDLVSYDAFPALAALEDSLAICKQLNIIIITINNIILRRGRWCILFQNMFKSPAQFWYNAISNSRKHYEPLWIIIIMQHEM